MRVDFVMMPFGPIHVPSLALGMLRASMDRSPGRTSKIHYLNLDYAKRISPSLYTVLSVQLPYNIPALTADWIFSKTLFGYDVVDDKTYIDSLFAEKEDSHEYGVRYLFDQSHLEGVLRCKRDADSFLQNCLDQIRVEDIDVLAFSSTFRQHIPSLALAKQAKLRNPKLAVIFGGANCEGEMGAETIRAFPFVDFVVSGPGERVIHEIVNVVENNSYPNKIPNVLVSDQSRFYEPTTSTEKLSDYYAAEDMTDLPPPILDDYFEALENHFGNRSLCKSILLEGSRGCSWGQHSHCIFCGLNGSNINYRSRPTAHVITEIEHISSKHSVRNIRFSDNIVERRVFHELLPHFAERKDKDTFFFFEILPTLREKDVALLQKGGVHTVQPGIESLSNKVLRLMKKGTSALYNVRILRLCREYGIGVDWNIIYGFPEETASDYEGVLELMPLLSHLTPPDVCSRFRVDRFSPLYDTLRTTSPELLTPLDAYSAIYDPKVVDINKIAYHFVYRSKHSSEREKTYNAMVDLSKMWKDSHHTSKLELRGDAEGAYVTDTRPCAKMPSVPLTPLQLAILKVCRDGVDRKRIATKLDTPVDETLLEAGVSFLMEHGFVCDLDGVILNLVCFPKDHDARSIDWWGDSLATFAMSA